MMSEGGDQTFIDTFLIIQMKKEKNQSNPVFINFDILNIKFFIKIIDPFHLKDVLAYIRICICYLAQK